MSLTKVGFRAGLMLSALLASSVLTARPTFASLLFYLNPMIANLAPAGRESSQAFEVANASQEQPVAVELYMAKREIAIDGSETYIPEEAENDFLIYPPQTYLKPGEAQTVRITWLGDPNPPQELAYRLIAQQVPLDTDTQSTNIQGREVNVTTLVRYAGSVYITPEGATPNVTLDNVVHQKSETGEDELVITFHNQGTAHTLLNDLTLGITPANPTKNSPTITLTPEMLIGISGENILAQSKRQFRLPYPEELPVGDVDVTFDFNR